MQLLAIAAGVLIYLAIEALGHSEEQKLERDRHYRAMRNWGSVGEDEE